MVMGIHDTDFYLYEKKRDLLILQLKTPPNGEFRFIFGFDRDDEVTQRFANEQLQWFEEREIGHKITCSPGLLAGWNGLYYIDIDPASELVVEYSKQFEDADGKSLHPEYYQMTILSYDIWVSDSGIERYEQHLRDLADPDYNP